MAISGAQHGRHNKEWQLVCEKRHWDPKDAAIRLKFYEDNGLPPSRADWHPKHDFDRFLEAVAPLQYKVDIRDRERETVEISIVRLGSAIAELTGKTAADYVQGITADMNDSGEPLELPLDPREAQRARGVQKIRPDLANLRDTLKNRLGKLITAVKDGTICPPPGKDWYLECANNATIGGIVRNQVPQRHTNGREVWYTYISHLEYAELKAKGAAARAVQPSDGRARFAETADSSPPVKKPRREKVAMRVSAEALAIAEHGADIEIPF